MIGTELGQGMFGDNIDGVDGQAGKAEIGVIARGAMVFSGGGLSGSVVMASSTFLQILSVISK